jgi:hypothetical protein
MTPHNTAIHPRQEHTMKRTIAAAALAASALAGTLALAGPAAAAPQGAGNAEQTIMELENSGNRVVVTRLSPNPLQEASVVSVTHGPVVRGGVPFATSQGDNFRSVATQTVYVTVK